MGARNIKQLNAMLKHQLEKAMRETSQKVFEDMTEETKGFYSKGTPVMYERTGALGETPHTTSLASTEREVSFNAYLDTSHRYTTGKQPTMEDVLNLTKATPVHKSSVGYLRSAKGDNGFWERAEGKMGKRLDESISKYFT